MTARQSSRRSSKYDLDRSENSADDTPNEKLDRHQLKPTSDRRREQVTAVNGDKVRPPDRRLGTEPSRASVQSKTGCHSLARVESSDNISSESDADLVRPVMVKLAAGRGRRYTERSNRIKESLRRQLFRRSNSTKRKEYVGGWDKSGSEESPPQRRRRERDDDGEPSDDPRPDKGRDRDKKGSSERSPRETPKTCRPAEDKRRSPRIKLKD